MASRVLDVIRARMKCNASIRMLSFTAEHLQESIAQKLKFELDLIPLNTSTVLTSSL